MSNKIVISKPGYSALVETNPDHLVFSSDYPTLKYFMEGFIDLNWSEGSTLWDYALPHNLGYIPFFLASVHVGGGSLYSLCPRNDHTAAGENYTNAYADSTYLHFQKRVNQGLGRSGVERFYYKIFKNNLNL